MIYLQTVGADKVQTLLRAFGANARKALAIAMTHEAYALIEEAKNEIPKDVGTLRASGYVEPAEYEGNQVIVECGFGGAASAYAIYVHEGTGPAVGHGQYWPPADALVDWARRHGFDSPYAVQWAIHEHGTQPRKYLENPMNRRAQGLEERIAEDLKNQLTA